MRRRDLLKHAASAGLAVPLAAHAASSTQATTAATAPAGHTQDDLPDGRMVRKAWVARLTRIAEPVLTHLAAGTLKRAMPVEGSADRRAVTHLEAFGHTLSGVAPWLDLPADDTAEGRTRARLTQLAGDALREATDPGSPDALNFSEGSQPLHQPGIGERYISTGASTWRPRHSAAWATGGRSVLDWTGSRMDRPPRVEPAAVSNRQRAQRGLGRRCRTEGPRPPA
jgi:hypothetical protein